MRSALLAAALLGLGVFGAPASAALAQFPGYWPSPYGFGPYGAAPYGYSPYVPSPYSYGSYGVPPYAYTVSPYGYVGYPYGPIPTDPYNTGQFQGYLVPSTGNVGGTYQCQDLYTGLTVFVPGGAPGSNYTNCSFYSN
jgi:hypothetical protein